MALSDNDDATVNKFAGQGKDPGRKAWANGAGTYKMKDGREILDGGVTLRPHESFKPTVHARRSYVATTEVEDSDPILARPPGWTEAGVPCIPTGGTKVERRAHMDMWDLGSGDHQAKRASELCDGCPVRIRCLAAALEEEGSVPAQYRYLVRGGTTPEMRRKMYESGMRVGA